MNMKKTLIALVALPMVLGSAGVMARGGDHGSQGGKHGGLGFDHQIMKQLELTDAQKEEFKTLHKQMREEGKAAKQDRSEKRAAMKANRDQMEKLILAEKFDESAVRDLAQKMANDRIEGEVKFAKARHDMMQILTPEQRQKLQEIRKEQQAKRLEKMKEHVKQMEQKAE